MLTRTLFFYYCKNMSYLLVSYVNFSYCYGGKFFARIIRWPKLLRICFLDFSDFYLLCLQHFYHSHSISGSFCYNFATQPRIAKSPPRCSQCATRTMNALSDLEHASMNEAPSCYEKQERNVNSDTKKNYRKMWDTFSTQTDLEKIIKNKIEWLILIYVASSRCFFWGGGKATHHLIILKLMESQKHYIPILKYFIKRKKSKLEFFLVRLYCQNNHKWKLPQAADKKLNSQAWNIGMTESYEEIDSSNSLLTVEHHIYLAKGSVTYIHVIYFKTSLSESFLCFVFQIPTQYVDCRLIYNFADSRSKKHHDVKV